MGQLDLIDMYRAFHPKTMNFTFFSSAHRTFSRIDHILGHQSSLGKFLKSEIISSMFSDHNAVRLDANYREKKKTIKNTNIWRLNLTLLNNQQITEEIEKDIKICIETNENENTTTQTLWDSVKAVLRGTAAAGKSLQSCPTLCDPIDSSPPAPMPPPGGPWDSPGKNTVVGCHFLLQCMKVKSESEVTQSCLTLSDHMDCSLPGSSIHGIFQARVLEWVAIAFSAKGKVHSNTSLKEETRKK